MALYFPDTPAIGDEFENGFVKWIWDGIKWTGGGSLQLFQYTLESLN
jgi:hypothetical protein